MMLSERTNMEKQQFKSEDVVFLKAQKIIKDYESGLVVNNEIKRKINRMTGYLLLDKSLQNKNEIINLATDLVESYEKSVSEMRSNNISDFKETLGLKKLEIKMSKLTTEIENKIKSREAKKIIEKRLLERSQKSKNEKLISNFKSDMEVEQINESLKLQDNINKEIKLELATNIEKSINTKDINSMKNDKSILKDSNKAEKNKESKNKKEEDDKVIKEVESEDLIDKLLRKRRGLSE